MPSRSFKKLATVLACGVSLFMATSSGAAAAQTTPSPLSVTGTIGSGYTAGSGDIPTSYCQATYKIWENTGSVSVYAEGVCSQTIAQISVQAILYSNNGTIQRANSGVQTANNVAIYQSNNATSQCGSSCGSWNWWIGVIFVSFTSSNGWSGGTTGWCAVGPPNVMNCNGDTSTFTYTL